MSSVISVDTSVTGRFQFSTENAYSVSTSIPSRADAFDDVAHRLDAGAMPLDPRQVALRRPAPVAVHDHRDVPRQPVEVDLPRQRLLGRPGRDDGENVLERHGSWLTETLMIPAVTGGEQGPCPERALPKGESKGLP